MKLQLHGEIQCYYDKINSDGNNTPSENTFEPCIFEIESVAVGLICCMDINDPQVYVPVIDDLMEFKCENKVLAISAFMTDRSWFSGDSVASYLSGLYVVLANGCGLGPKSFITDAKGNKLSSSDITLGNVSIINYGVT
ncbi:MAG: hypothetical protein KZQ93_09580 [Candidatus Thiodiazotropha sp. (ex Monitilora ramsayi)]|nr:hypothetical protein [Candidatus Thiodiazotropha sp. (ex Monitilora ramsayi)]